MKNLILTFLLSFTFLAVGTSQISFGAGASYWGEFGVQARANIDMESFDIIPKATYYFVDGVTNLVFDADLAFNVATVGDDIPVYAFAGPSINRLSNDFISATELGINAGIGARLTNLYIEVKYGFLLCDGCDGDIGFAAGYMF